ncbi:type I-E CRISPR-associated protein Cas5/CasD [Maridesulfovibrio sp.]|uniref:type I-E CRISPR-associated protein Cas5/CasD n=1 Tax=Maridesulfovibrio sp. TaxID=2795000 RepID=UPI0029C9C927|nr:type I-E CRISPR-associated protein Cas5/CasD [Maridesulfovibrio sp.]
MRYYLVFTIYGLMQGWGSVAVGEVRPAAPRPTRSGLLGLLAAALGVRRGDPLLTELSDAARVAVREDRPGSVMLDYHTTQVPSEKKNRIYRTRRQELGTMLDKDDKLNTILSRREYLMNAAFSACIWFEEEPPFAMEDMVEALKQPRLNVYFGRKSCPPGFPFMPEIVAAEDELQALVGYTPELRNLYGARSLDKCPVWTEADHGKFSRYSVRDRVTDHNRRQYGLRFEYHVPSLKTGEE